jgi:ureidoglycolate lyase
VSQIQIEGRKPSLEPVVNIKAELMTEESFRPFGALLSRRLGSPDFHGVASEGWKTPFEIDGAPELMLLVSRFSGMQFTKLERHFGVTQTFIPIGPVPALLAVAAPTDPGDPGAIPKPDEVRAFVVDGSCGYVLRRGTWHSLDRYPLYPAESQIVILTSHETQVELETAQQSSWRLTQQVDYEKEFGVTFQLGV